VTHELAVLQATRLKGRLSAELAAASCSIASDDAVALLTSLREAGLVKGEPSVRLTPEGRARLGDLVSEERASIDTKALEQLYQEFDSHNTELKQVVSDWQLRDGEPNDHGDATYDETVIASLVAVDDGFQPLVTRIAEVAPRLAVYVSRFGNALDHIRAGDTGFVARPIIDSYHTVWFEFHEELIGLLGLSREQEAAAGRAV
jgi:hypothetical protein